MATRAGTTAGLLAVSNTLDAFDVKAVIVVGVAGGLGPASIGDIVVADRVIGYEYGKQDGTFIPRDDWILRADGAIVNAAKALKGDPGWWRAAGNGQAPAIHIGAIASGEKVVDDVEAPGFKPVLERWPKLIAVEMEGYGALEAIYDAREKDRGVSFGMIRGISDLPRRGRSAAPAGGESAQTLERDSSKPLASRNAARVASHIVRTAWPRPPRA
jgi:nucleoside phosphorylase